MIGYKCTDQNGCCRGFQFKVGKTYKKNTPKNELKCCTDKVFHFCRELFAIEKVSDYKLSESRIFEVIAGDYVKDGDKYGTNCLKIIREIKGVEKQELLNSGYFNSNSPKRIRIFNKEIENQNIKFPDFLYFDLTVWVSYDTATEKEKKEHSKEIETTGGFIKVLGYKEAFRLAWDKADKSEHKQLLTLPNWDNKIFKEISGIDAEAEIKKEND